MNYRRTALLALGALAFVIVPAWPAQAETVITSNISTSTHWTEAGSPYVVERTTFKVLAGATLTIDPGVRVEFNQGWTSKMIVEGSLVAIGEDISRIIFTSGQDTSPGEWYYLEFAGGSSATLAYVDIRHSGGLQSSTPWNYGALRMSSTGLVTLSDARIYDNYNSGVRATSTGMIQIADSLVERNDIGVSIIGGSSGGGAAEVTRSTFRENLRQGFFISHAATPLHQTLITSSEIVDNGLAGVHLQEEPTFEKATFPSATYSNIYGNDGGSPNLQLTALWPRVDAWPLWDENFWGYTAVGPVLCPIASSGWMMHVFYADHLWYPQEGPVPSWEFEYEDVHCRADKVAVGSIRALEPWETGAP